MRVISNRILREFWEKHSQSQSGLLVWYQRILDSELETLNDVRKIFQSRLITYINYEFQLLFIRTVLTYAEYDKENWKNDEWLKNS
ncbi:type II toxin-antitoxin system HigB family toxin [Trichormus azollae]|uniref:type II toxin-antitoxin system HigB family toxin n=1 Tax=Trichormus azollae TaxID=1164 RepID=UPI00325D853E